jgi:hypothetical protein
LTPQGGNDVSLKSPSYVVASARRVRVVGILSPPELRRQVGDGKATVDRRGTTAAMRLGTQPLDLGYGFGTGGGLETARDDSARQPRAILEDLATVIGRARIEARYPSAPDLHTDSLDRRHS